MDEDVLTTLKILIIGESGVGKSSLLLRFTDDTFDPELAATIGVDFKVKTISVDGNKAKLAIWENREVDRNEGLKFARKHSMLFIEASAKTCDGVQCAFEELVEKIIQTPGLWESENQNKGVKLLDREEGHGGGACGGYCSVL
ncbi:PREDICTED: ras-related protein Rab-18-like isoform X3 [Chrysochloris asiatica]|uniref:Ras-related protein Rab-18-like isoform X3 n=1 Tax=Chrysochloris asiatica TaxID=185453 RepID=A0A9B0WYH0_CHRAS|nr:PREDICTED: ras-related protein Rab-18-like isoform X3 [Chrysochloris asiatica]